MIQLEQVSKVYGTGSVALDDLTLSIEKGEFVFLVGPSGSGKTTLLRLLIRDMLPTKGKIVVNGLDVVKMTANKVPVLRRKIGVVFQDLKLLMDRTIFENIMLPLEMSNIEHKHAEKKVQEILEQVGIEEHKHKFPVQLSGGELQRAAIARALVFSPEILLADEPTGNLDNTTSWEIVKILQDINKSGTTVIMATHNTDIVNSLLKRILVLEKGKLMKDEDRSGKKAKGNEHKAEGKDLSEEHSEKSNKEEESRPKDDQPLSSDKQDLTEKETKEIEEAKDKKESSSAKALEDEKKV